MASSSGSPTGPAPPGPVEPDGWIEGGLRIQVLSPTLVRLEWKGPRGFEDRPSFHIVGRAGWPGAAVRRREHRGAVLFETEPWTLLLPPHPSSPSKLLFLVRGGGRYRPGRVLRNAAWLPAPGATPVAWAIADTPRLIPAPEGFAAAPTASSDSGWDLGNDAPDLYVFLPGGSYRQLRQDFLKLTGSIEMPPLHALGFVDSRYYPYRQAEALQRIDEYRRRQIPLDLLVIDTDWRVGGSHGYAVDPVYFPDLPAFLSSAHQKQVRVMFNDHPEPVGRTALDPEELRFRVEGLGGLLRSGLDVWWYDCNWKTRFRPPTSGLSCQVWGMKLYHDITQQVRPDRRALIMANVDGIRNGRLQRPPSLAAHRYPVQWTGDTRSRWKALRRGVENAVLEGVLGLNPWVNEDLGGHVGTPSPDLYIRYLQFGSVSPFMRVHCTRGHTREPWAFGAEAERIAAEYIRMRYRLMPLLYASARAAFEEGEPLLRRLDLEHPSFAEAAANDQFLIGDALLVAPVADRRGRRSIWIPPGRWTDLWTGAGHSGPGPLSIRAPLAQMPMLIRSGAIIPLGPEVQWVGQEDWTNLALLLSPGSGRFRLYEDDGCSLGYQRGELRRTAIEMVSEAETLAITIAPAQGSCPGVPATRAWTLRLLLAQAAAVRVDGEPVEAVTLARADRQPFQIRGGEPAGPLLEIKLPVAPVSRGWRVEIEGAVGGP